MLKKGTTIISAANLKNYMSKILKDIDKDQEPVFITVNGDGSHVIMHIEVYDELRYYKQQCIESGVLKYGEWRGVIENSKRPLKSEFYDVLKATYKEEWESLTPEQLENVRKGIEEEQLRNQHWSECINAKTRAFNSLFSECQEFDNSAGGSRVTFGSQMSAWDEYVDSVIPQTLYCIKNNKVPSLESQNTLPYVLKEMCTRELISFEEYQKLINNWCVTRE